MSTKTSAQAAATMQKEVRELQTVFSATNFIAFVEVLGEDANGNSFSINLTLDSKDPEFKQLINDYGARKSAQIMELMNLPKPPAQ